MLGSSSRSDTLTWEPMDQSLGVYHVCENIVSILLNHECVANIFEDLAKVGLEWRNRIHVADPYMARLWCSDDDDFIRDWKGYVYLLLWCHIKFLTFPFRNSRGKSCIIS